MYTTIDRRLLGLFRIVFGCLLLLDVLRRLPDATFFYSNSGVLSNHFALFAPLAKPYFSLYTAFSTPAEVRFAFLATALVFVFYIVGYGTRVTQILAFVLITSLNTRNIFLENGGCIVVNLVATWTMFLPLGDRFSVDSLRRRLRRRERTYDDLNDRTFTGPDLRPYQSLAVLAILLQIACIYFFNAIHKTGATWRQGEAIHWVLWQNRIATSLAGWLRLHEPSWLSPVMTRGTLVIEGAVPLLLFSPYARARLRTLHVLATTALHGGIALLITLGPFSYAMICLNLLALPGELFDRIAARWRRDRTPAHVLFDPADLVAYAAVRVLSRLDAFALLTFAPFPEPPETATSDLSPADTALAVRGADGATWCTGREALFVAVRALPLGRLGAWLLVSPVGAMALNALLDHPGVLTSLVEPLALPPGGAEPAAPSASAERWSQLRHQTSEGLVALLLLAMVIDVSRTNRAVPEALRLPLPTALAPLILYPRLLQGWSMFAPEAPQEDGTVVVDGITTDGRHLDPFTGAPPDFDAPLHGPWFQSQFWCDYFLKISWDGNKRYREELKTYLLAWQQLKNRPPPDRLVSVDVWWISNRAPPPGSTLPYDVKRRLLLSASSTPAAP